MITVTIYKNSSQQYTGFSVEGHAGYADEGFDIICSAVSALAVNAVNSLEAFTEDDFAAEESNGFLTCSFSGILSEKGVLLVDSMVLGLTDIQNNYGKQYIRMVYKEV